MRRRYKCKRDEGKVKNPIPYLLCTTRSENLKVSSGVGDYMPTGGVRRGEEVEGKRQSKQKRMDIEKKKLRISAGGGKV